ncbi:MAG: hypothetical protein HZB59_08390 [Ignavibacteriales bacterium]|nr:hypothetical protein [Ignavibacteriales bacterium]
MDKQDNLFGFRWNNLYIKVAINSTPLCCFSLWGSLRDKMNLYTVRTISKEVAGCLSRIGW